MALRTLWSPALAALSLFLLDGAAHVSSRSASSTPSPKSADPAVAQAQFARLPLRFEHNAGQWDDDVRFVARRGTTQLILRDAGAMLAANGTAIRLTPAGGRVVEPVASH